MILRWAILVCSLVAVGASVWLTRLDVRVARRDGMWHSANWTGRAIARLGAAVIVVEIAKLVWRMHLVAWNADSIAYTVGLAGYALGTALSLVALHPEERAQLKEVS